MLVSALLAPSRYPVMPPRRHLRYCFGKSKIAESHIKRAEKLISSGHREEVLSSLVSLDSALELFPLSEKALELKARALLYLKRYKDVIEMLYEFLPSFNNNYSPEVSSTDLKERMQLLSIEPNSSPQQKPKLRCHFSALIRMLSSSLPSKRTVQVPGLEWRYLILGQACYHLGMLEDATTLLQIGKKSATDASRRHSNGMKDDNFCSDHSIVHTVTCPAEFSLVNHMIANIKLLLRRRSAALAALEAGLYPESVRHFSKIIEGQKGTPPWFIADCYLHRAIAYQATGKVVDAIADCNKNLALNPKCTKALSVRASLHEMVKSFSECLLDLQQLKMIFEASRRSQGTVLESIQWTIQQRINASEFDISGGLEYIDSKIIAIRRRLCHGSCSLDARMILDMPENCSMEDVEKAYLLLSLKHSPDKAASFLNNCCQQLGQQDCYSRDMEIVKEEAKASAVRLSKLIHKAYTKLLSLISEKQAEEQKELNMMNGAGHRRKRSNHSDMSKVRRKGQVSYPETVIDPLERRASLREEISFSSSSSSIGNYSLDSHDDGPITPKHMLSSNNSRCIDEKINPIQVEEERACAQGDDITESQAPDLVSQVDNKNPNPDAVFSDSSDAVVHCGNEARNKPDIAIILEAFRGLNILGDGKQNAEELTLFLEQGRVGELCELVSNSNGEMSASGAAIRSAISQAFSEATTDISAHHWLGSPWNLSPLHPQLLSVT